MKFADIGRSRPEAYGVIYKDANGGMHKAYLVKSSKSEIILSAGALGSPQLLMLSGIGPAHHLQAHGIEVVLDQPMVGQGMADNPMNVLFIPSPMPVEVSLVQVVGITRFGSYIEATSGLSFLHSWGHKPSEYYYELFLNQVPIFLPLFYMNYEKFMVRSVLLSYIRASFITVRQNYNGRIYERSILMLFYTLFFHGQV